MLGAAGCSQTMHVAKQEDDPDNPFSSFEPKLAKQDGGAEKQAQITPPQMPNRQQPRRVTTPKLPRQYAGMPGLSQRELMLIADRIFQNESGGNPDNLVHWNDGENFASMGLGHFTWYPVGQPPRFGNTFPEMIDYLQAHGVSIPAWVLQSRHYGAPWRSKAELMHAKYTGQVRDLQGLLYQTRFLQAAFIAERARRALPLLVETAPQHTRARVAQNLNAVANTPGGWYALIDYVNFKGEGLNIHGGYRGQNWGLLQVLEEMQPTPPGPQALHHFADAATRVLERRVRNAPRGRNEARWLAGWTKRINTYRYPGV